MQKNLLSYLLGIVALTFICSCGTCKKDEVKVDVKDIEQVDKKSDNKEVAQAATQPAGAVVAQNDETDASKAVKTQEDDTPKAQEEDAPKAQEENKA